MRKSQYKFKSGERIQNGDGYAGTFRYNEEGLPVCVMDDGAEWLMSARDWERVLEEDSAQPATAQGSSTIKAYDKFTVKLLNNYQYGSEVSQETKKQLARNKIVLVAEKIDSDGDIKPIGNLGIMFTREEVEPVVQPVPAQDSGTIQSWDYAEAERLYRAATGAIERYNQYIQRKPDTYFGSISVTGTYVPPTVGFTSS